MQYKSSWKLITLLILAALLTTIINIESLKPSPNSPNIPNYGYGFVINEVYYDPTGTDSGNEWIEIYHPTGTTHDFSSGVDGNLIIEFAGTSFTSTYTVTSGSMAAGSYLLIGASSESRFSTVTFDISVTNFAFENGDSATCGVRISLEWSGVEDTVLYGTPNTNSLPDDVGSPGTNFAPDVAEGSSLARKTDGTDTDDCSADFQADSTPSPGISNASEVPELNANIKIEYLLAVLALIPIGLLLILKKK